MIAFSLLVAALAAHVFTDFASRYSPLTIRYSRFTAFLPLLVAASIAVLQRKITVQYNIANQMSKGSGGRNCFSLFTIHDSRPFPLYLPCISNEKLHLHSGKRKGGQAKHLRRNPILEHPARCRYGQKEWAANLDNACAVARLSVWNHGCSRIIIIDADVGRA